MRENLIKIILLWGIQLFLILLLLGLLIDNSFPLLIKVILFCGLLAVFDSVVAKKTIMSISKENYHSNGKNECWADRNRIVLINDKRKNVSI